MNNAEYLSYRKTKRTVKYKLRRRTEIMLEMINTFKKKDDLSILDVGAADGYMLAIMKDALKARTCLGIEPSLELASSRADKSVPLLQAVGECLPFKDSTFDVITAASVLDHLKEPETFLRECRRVLKREGIVVISLVAPFYDKLAVSLKIKDNDHLRRFTEKGVGDFLRTEKFKVLESRRFALPFFGLFFERSIENILNSFRIYWPMFYIIAVGQKEPDSAAH